MRIRSLLVATLGFCLCACAASNDKRPQPKEVNPGDATHAPSDAVVLFNGTSASEWVHKDGRAAEWPVVDGLLVCKSGSGHIFSKRKFGSAQIHVEFATPNMPQAHDQARGNSGVYLQGRYEIQILDSYKNSTYPDGSCAALYGQSIPLVNVTRPPEQWQSYDIIFHAPKCEAGKVVSPGSLTLLHNGVLVQDHFLMHKVTPGATHPNMCEPGPMELQDHFHPDVKETFLKFRNIWYRPLSD